MEGVNLIKQMFSANTVKQTGNSVKSGNNSFTALMGKTSAQTGADVKSNSAGTRGTGYGQYKYTEKNIQVSDKRPDQMKMDDVSKEAGQLKDELISAVADDLQVSEDELVTAMENLGMVWTDLLNQQNLADVTVELKLSGNSTELLLNPDFQNALVDVNQLVTEAANDLGMNVDEFTDIVSKMTQIEPEEAAGLDNMVLDALNNEAQETADDMTADNSADDTRAADIKGSDDVKASNDNLASYEENDMDGAANTSDLAKGSGDEEQYSGTQDKSAGIIFTQETDAGATAEISFDDADVGQRAFMSEETSELINQIVDNIRVNVSQDTTSIEMQLNPENLGRVYVHLSAKEGTVNAQFTATNEVVKEALEAQVAALKENLNQAGVKVDAVEVTVSSHEFERNLEQDQSREEQEGEYQETAAKQRRRNINMTSLDELEGVMTEEESLVAQIMKDNGNSVDMTV